MPQPGWDVPVTPPPRRRWPIVLAAGVWILIAVAGVGAVLGWFGDDGPDHPDEWDPRVADLADFVADERGLQWDHPVYVDFLTGDEYTAASTGEDAPDEDPEELARYEGELRALGVASGPLDLAAAFDQLSDGGTLAFYDPVDARIRVRGTEMTVGMEVTLVHELTHALQDQHFDLRSLNGPELDSGEATAFRALVEGDAIRIERAYEEEELTADEQEAYDEEYAGEIDASEASTEDVPAFVSATFGAPYALGEPFVLALDSLGGNTRMDAAFQDPPSTEEHLFDPATFLDGEGADEIDLGFSDDTELQDEGPFGITSWYLVLAERIDPKVAFEAALGWNGDAFAAFERDGETCVRAGFLGDTDEDEREMRAALGEWAASMPDGVAQVADIGGHPGLESCDPGDDVDLALTGRSESSLYLPSLWGYLVASASGQLDPEASRCYAREVIEDLSYEQITDPDGKAFETQAFQDSLDAAALACS